MTMNIRNLLRLFAAVLGATALLTVTACGGQPAQQADGTATVRINQAFQSLLYLPLYVAQEKGYFTEQGVTVEIATGGGGTQSWAAVVGGSADFSIQDPVFVPKSRENGGPGVVVAAIQNAPSVFVIGREGATASLDDASVFEGKKVVVSPEPDTSWAFMKYLIDEQGLQDVTLVNVALGSELAAVAGGQADLALSFEPTVSQAVVDQGLEVVYSFPANSDWYPFAFSSLTTTERYLQGNTEAAQAVVTAIAKASRFIYSDPEATIDIAAQYFPDLSREVVQAAVEREIEAKGYAEDVTVTKESWDNNMKISLFTKNIAAYPSDATSYENNVNTEFATKARDAFQAG
ncbi:ABC transporter substrate-binding protein [Mycolicibacterium vaccae]|uniref:ABC transporter periplasmic protein n=1 Tax=Mycolicibacterium vaccae ATCC 25954 TaxID=1194972 RepID=K0UVP0_MYCVA|nr:ABC transporter substrate-binding protein [Mycolicibacterium vaccae]ANI41545.1 ABC transporter substrate-binding protein [Mycolicibacterium vaccae 95051]EJZ06673.1 ABC transporter periplasmic protein [Mycolicibacterium vaccae ATCC 25954]